LKSAFPDTRDMRDNIENVQDAYGLCNSLTRGLGNEYVPCAHNRAFTVVYSSEVISETVRQVYQ